MSSRQELTKGCARLSGSDAQGKAKANTKGKEQKEKGNDCMWHHKSYDIIHYGIIHPPPPIIATTKRKENERKKK